MSLYIAPPRIRDLKRYLFAALVGALLATLIRTLVGCSGGTFDVQEAIAVGDEGTGAGDASPEEVLPRVDTGDESDQYLDSRHEDGRSEATIGDAGAKADLGSGGDGTTLPDGMVVGTDTGTDTGSAIDSAKEVCFGLTLGEVCVIDSFWCCDQPRCCVGTCIHTTEGLPQYGRCKL